MSANESRSVTFYLGVAADLNQRVFQIRDRNRPELGFVHNETLAGSATTVEVDLQANRSYTAILTDRRNSVDGIPTTFHFTLHEDVTFQSGPISILSFEDTSLSSSSSNSSSSNSSSSTSSQSSSSTS